MAQLGDPADPGHAQVVSGSLLHLRWWPGRVREYEQSTQLLEAWAYKCHTVTSATLGSLRRITGPGQSMEKANKLHLVQRV